MKKFIDSQASQHEMKLIQMGAKVEQINSKMCYIKFYIDEIEVSYVYSINKRNKFFLERIKPYPLPIKDFEKEEDAIELIEIDIKQFQNASKSRNIDQFIHINSGLNKTIKQFEDLFLYYNVPHIETEIIMAKITEIQQEIHKTKENSKRVFFEKEPENL